MGTSTHRSPRHLAQSPPAPGDALSGSGDDAEGWDGAVSGEGSFSLTAAPLPAILREREGA